MLSQYKMASGGAKEKNNGVVCCFGLLVQSLESCRTGCIA